MMVRFLGVVMLALICIVVALFAVSNMSPLTLRLQVLFPGGITMMASLWILFTAAAGMILGMLFGWMIGGPARARARQATANNRRLKKQVESLTKLTAAGGAKSDVAVAVSTRAPERPSQKSLAIEG